MDTDSEKLLFHKGYMLYQRLPQEQGLLDRYRAWTGHDAWEDSAHTLRDAILRNLVQPASTTSLNQSSRQSSAQSLKP